MRSICTLLFASILFSFGFTQQPKQDFQSVVEQYSSPDRLMIGFESGVSHEQAITTLRAAKLTPVVISENDFNASRFLMGIRMAGGNIKESREDLLEDPKVSWAYPVLQDKDQRIMALTNRINIRPADQSYREKIIAFLNAQHCLNIRDYKFDAEIIAAETNKNSKADPITICMQLAELGWVKWAEPDFLYHVAANTNDFYYNRQWHLENVGSAVQGNGTPGADMNLSQAWTITTGDSTTIIGIIDSGTDTLHPDLVDNMVTGYDGTGGGMKGYPNTNYDEDGHGTSTAGIAAAKGENTIGVAGVCYDCSIMPVRVFYYAYDSAFGVVPWGTGTWMADGLNWAYQNGADVLSNSWGIIDVLIPIIPGGTAIVEDAINDAYSMGRHGKGCLSVFSSGNEGTAPIWPSRLANAIAVNATSMCDEPKTPVSCDGQNWSGNSGDSLDVSAPGVRIMTTDFSGANGYTNGDYITDFGGTSAACPCVAGILGLFYSNDTTATADQLREHLEAGCEKVGNVNYFKPKKHGYWSNELGFGRVNAFHTLNLYVSQDKQSLPDGFRLYPNPAKQNVVIEAAGFDSIAIIDMHGKRVFEAAMQSFRHQIDLADFATGLYTVEVSDNANRMFKKLQIIR